MISKTCMIAMIPTGLAYAIGPSFILSQHEECDEKYVLHYKADKMIDFRFDRTSCGTLSHPIS